MSGRLRVNAPLSFSLKVLSPLLVEFMALYPQLSVELTLDDHLLDPVSEGFDVSLRIRSSLPDSSLIARRLGEVEQVICASPGYLAARARPGRWRTCVATTASPTAWPTTPAAGAWTAQRGAAWSCAPGSRWTTA